jgi:hypothetical protein
VGAPKGDGDGLVARVHAMAQLAHLSFEIEIDLPVADVDGRGGDDELHPKALALVSALDANTLKLGLDSLQRGKERKLEDVRTGKFRERLIAVKEDRPLEMLADVELDGNVEASVQSLVVLVLVLGDSRSERGDGEGSEPHHSEHPSSTHPMPPFSLRGMAKIPYRITVA